MKKGGKKGGKEGRRERKNNIFVTLSINQTESQQNLNMKSDTWSWTRSSSIQLNVFVELKKRILNAKRKVTGTAPDGIISLYSASVRIPLNLN